MLNILKPGSGIGESVSRMVETGHGYAINSQYHNDNLQPQTGEFSTQHRGDWRYNNLLKNCYNNIVANTTGVGSFINSTSNSTRVIKDDFVENKYYSVVTNYASIGNSSGYIDIKSYVNNEVELNPMSNIYLSSNFVDARYVYGAPVEYMGQTENHLFILMEYQYSTSQNTANTTAHANGGCTLMKINKDTLSVEISPLIDDINLTYFYQLSTAKRLYEDYNYIYFVYFCKITMAMNIVKFDKYNGVMSTTQNAAVATKAAAGWYRLYYNSYVTNLGWYNTSGYFPAKTINNVIKRGNNIIFYDLMFRYVSGDKPNQYSLIEYTINTANENYLTQVTTRELSLDSYVDLNIFPMVWNSYTNNYLDIFIKEKDGNVYVNLTTYYCGNSTARPAASLAEKQGIVTLRVNDYDLTYTGKCKISDGVNYGLLYSNNMDFCVSPTQSTIAIVNWDNDLECYVPTREISDSVYTLSLDSSDNIITSSINGSSNLYNVSTPTEVRLEAPVGLDLTYAGENIPTQLKLICKNYNGERISSNFTITIEGNAKFTDNGLKTINVSSSISSDLIIPITITGEGSIYFYPKIVFN